MAVVTKEISLEIRKMVYEFFAEECEKDISELKDITDIINELDGDSLLFVELLQLLKKRYNLKVSMQSIGKYMLKNRAETIGKVIDLMIYVVENDSEMSKASN